MSITQILELKRDTGMYFVLSLIFLGVIMALPLAFAQPVLLSVERSDTCKASTKCLDLTDIIPLDTSNQKVSGILHDDHRGKPAYRNHAAFYQFSKEKFIVCVECDGTFQTHAKIITIESPKNFTYVKMSDHVISNNTFYDYSSRHIDPNCRTATVSSDMGLIKDTIFVMGNNCKVPSKYVEQNKTIKPYTKLNICGLECQHQKFMKDAKAKSKSTFLINPSIKLKTQNDKVKVN